MTLEIRLLSETYRTALLPGAVVIGLFFGSFLNCTAMRIVRGQDWVRERSRCPACGHVLSAVDLIPIAGFLIRRGKCAWCGGKISLRYPVTELLFAGITGLVVWKTGLSINTIRYFIFACSLYVLSLTDMEARRIPNGCLFTALVGWLVTEPWLFRGWTDLCWHIAAMIGCSLAVLCLSLIMDRVLKKESLGGGDVKLIALLGLYLGVVGTMFALFFASVLGILYAAVKGKLGRGQVIAFGPFLAAAGFGMAVAGEGLVARYMGLLTGW